MAIRKQGDDLSRRWRPLLPFEILRERQVTVLRLAVLILLVIQALVLQRCYYSCFSGTDRLQVQLYAEFTARNSSRLRISQRGSDKGPFRTWEEAREALHSIRQRDVQLEIGAPLNDFYRQFRLDGRRLGHLPPPPAQCSRYYDEDSPVNIDVALVRMVGEEKSKIPTNLVRDLSFAIHLSTNYTTRFPLEKSITIYVLKDGKLYFDRRSNHPRSCGHQHKIVGFLSFMREAVRLGLPRLPDVAFRFSCLDNPYPPFQGLWTYSSFKYGQEGPLAFPDDYFTFERWKRLRADSSEPAFRNKASRAAWFGGKTGDVPLHHAGRKGFLDLEYVESIETVTSREYFVSRYSPGSDERVIAAFDKLPMATLLGRYRVLLAIAGHSFASNTLPLLFSNSLVVEQASEIEYVLDASKFPVDLTFGIVFQDYPVASWEDHFFLPGIHFLTIPRSMDDGVLQRILDLVEKPENDDYFTNMTRLAATVAELVVDPSFSSCYTHRALQLWNSRMEDKSLALDENLVEIVDFYDSKSSRENCTSPKQLLTRAFHTRVQSSFLGKLWESVLIWWWDIDYNATTYM